MRRQNATMAPARTRYAPLVGCALLVLALLAAPSEGARPADAATTRGPSADVTLADSATTTASPTDVANATQGGKPTTTSGAAVGAWFCASPKAVKKSRKRQGKKEPRYKRNHCAKACTQPEERAVRCCKERSQGTCSAKHVLPDSACTDPAPAACVAAITTEASEYDCKSDKHCHKCASTGACGTCTGRRYLTPEGDCQKVRTWLLASAAVLLAPARDLCILI